MAKKVRAERPPVAQTRADIPAVPEAPLATSRDLYASAEQRMENLPTASGRLTADRIQGTFAHMLMMTPADLVKMRRQGSTLSVLESQMLRIIQRTMRELPDVMGDHTDDNGRPVKDADGKVIRRVVALNPDTLQNEKQALENIKYLHERAFGKPKVTIEHTGLPDTNVLPFSLDMVLAAMDTLPRKVLDVISLPAKQKKASGV
jgi:hypothetical protein